MNERTLELAKQAGLKVESWMTNPPKPFQILGSTEQFEKFAELIIAECTEQVRGQYVPVIEDKEMMKDTHWDGYVQCGVDSVVAIREHFFGVEE